METSSSDNPYPSTSRDYGLVETERQDRTKLMSLAPVPDTCDEMVNRDCESRKKIRGSLCRLPSAVNVKLQLSNERNCRLQLFFRASKTMSISSFTLKDDAYFLSVAHVPCVM